MTFIFWQNILSIHQSAFINALSINHEVILIVEKASDTIRQQSGWNLPDFGCKKIIINPNLNEINRLIDNYADAMHVLSGLEVTFKQYKLTQKLLNGKFKVICYLEPFNDSGFKGLLRILKYKVLSIRYKRRLLAILPTGQMGVEQYKRIGFKNVFEWGYFTETPKSKIIDYQKAPKSPKLLFVGSLDTRKNILFLLNSMTSDPLTEIELTIIGNGPLKDAVERATQLHNNISYLGTKTNDDVKKMMYKHDILVLPSIFDGWGAVVNEALNSGMRVVCSDRCGASALLGESWRGSVFRSGDMQNFLDVMEQQLRIGIFSDKDREEIEVWCRANISGEAATDYFLQICSYQLGERNISPSAPWKR